MPKSPQQIREEFNARLRLMGMAYDSGGDPGAMSKAQMLEELKQHLRLSIATTLKIGAEEYETSQATRDAVDRCLTMVMAIGYNGALEDAANDIHQMPWNSGVDRHALAVEVQDCYDTFPQEVAVFTMMHELNQIAVDPEAILEHVSGFLDIGSAYEDLLP